VDGVVSAEWHSQCRRCLGPASGTVRCDVQELYQVDPVDEDAFPIEHDQLDLRPMTREVVLIEVPDGPLCRDDCAGLCPACGVDRNEIDCGCDTSVADERWAVLDQLREQLND
jgi:uncharacterized protein